MLSSALLARSLFFFYIHFIVFIIIIDPEPEEKTFKMNIEALSIAETESQTNPSAENGDSKREGYLSWWVYSLDDSWSWPCLNFTTGLNFRLGLNESHIRDQCQSHNRAGLDSCHSSGWWLWSKYFKCFAEAPYSKRLLRPTGLHCIYLQSAIGSIKRLVFGAIEVPFISISFTV